ncbi:MAG TPA: Hsp20/alpha crystallin family protein [Anaerolineae bacterium]|jgi:HSP20 family molecular chaperone IbpA|nr:Hsp20/alpha crystallin family protein [Anaerolineae bacterium]
MSDELQIQKQEVEPDEGVERTRASRVYVPRVDIYSEEEGVTIVADMPGVDENNVDILLEKDVLTISGFVTSEEPEGFDLSYNEYGVGDFRRSFTLMEEIARDKIEASISNGVLRVYLPKAPESQARKIAVQAG